MAESQLEKEDDKRSYIKKPLNAFMLYMREERPKVVAQCNVKESATINQILGQRVRLSAPPPSQSGVLQSQERVRLTDRLFSPQWHSLTKDEQAKYYEMARKERLVHSKLYPGWSARENYVSAAASLLIAAAERRPTTDLMCFDFFCRVKRRKERGPRVRAMKVNVSLVVR